MNGRARSERVLRSHVKKTEEHGEEVILRGCGDMPRIDGGVKLRTSTDPKVREEERNVCFSPCLSEVAGLNRRVAAESAE